MALGATGGAFRLCLVLFGTFVNNQCAIGLCLARGSCKVLALHAKGVGLYQLCKVVAI